MFILAAQDFVAEENGELVLRFHDDPAMMNDWPEDGVEAATAAKKPPVSATCGTRLPSGRRAGRRGRIVTGSSRGGCWSTIRTFA